MRQRARADNLTICYRKKNKLTSAFRGSPVIDNEFRHNVVKAFYDIIPRLSELNKYVFHLAE